MPVTLCFIKDKHKVMEHKIPLETYFAGLLQKVEWQIQEYEDTAADTLTLCRLCVDYLQEILGELKTFIISYPFASTEEEIHFFKELKPLLASKIIYYNTVYKIEVRFPSGSEDVQRDYLLSETDRISRSFQRNLAFYQYHRTKATYLDRQYFIRGKPDIQIIVDSFYYETDPQFSTSHDFKVAKILANELLNIPHQPSARAGTPGTAQAGEERLHGQAVALDGDEKGVGGTYLRTGRLRLSEQGNG